MDNQLTSAAQLTQSSHRLTKRCAGVHVRFEEGRPPGGSGGVTTLAGRAFGMGQLPPHACGGFHNVLCAARRAYRLRSSGGNYPCHCSDWVRPSFPIGALPAGQLRRQLPLPETASEVCSVGRSLGISDNELDANVRLGASEIKALSSQSKLANYRIVHFATHAALSGQVRGSAEPGLILTPPATASETDDGYLAASSKMSTRSAL